ncbi:MAG: sulfotransferase domain-containing protein, partial [Sedimentisphaerales bacterium]|nr:sulfotransferase domain-containing protein [Sedimentisphaerales bacterium]
YNPIGHVESKGVLNKIGYESFFYRHGSYMIDRAVYPTIRLHRNPLDFIVSWFFYRYKSRDDKTYLEAKESVESTAAIYARHVGKWYASPKNNEHFTLHYEELVTAPFDTFIRVLTYLKAPIDESALRKAIDASSFDRVRANEVNNGAIHGAVGQLHTRSGKIGEWKDHLDDKDVNLVQGILEKHGLLLDHFMTEPAVKAITPAYGVLQRVKFGLRTAIQRFLIPKN